MTDQERYEARVRETRALFDEKISELLSVYMQEWGRLPIETLRASYVQAVKGSMTLVFRCDVAKNRVRIFGRLPSDIDGGHPVVPGEKAIYISLNKTPKAIASEIYRRLLPEYEKRVIKAEEINEAYASKKESLDALNAAVADAMGAERNSMRSYGFDKYSGTGMMAHVSLDEVISVNIALDGGSHEIKARAVQALLAAVESYKATLSATQKGVE